MMIPQNFLKRDEFGRISGILEICKPLGLTSHDMVDFCRKVFRTKKVGHIGTLDPMATGLMHILIGKETKSAVELQEKEKTYVFETVLGLSSETFDLDAKKFLFNKSEFAASLNESSISRAIETFGRQYEQSVPIFSSVKIGGEKLHNLARNADKIEFFLHDGVEWVRFKSKGKASEVELPRKEVNIRDLKLLDISLVETIQRANYQFPENIFSQKILNSLNEAEKNNYYELIEKAKKNSRANLDNIFRNFEQQIALPCDKTLFKIKLEVTVSSGFYVRQFAQDIARKISPELTALVVSIDRTKVFF